MMICRTPNGKERPMTVRECATTGSTYIHVAADDLDALLAGELGLRPNALTKRLLRLRESLRRELEREGICV